MINVVNKYRHTETPNDFFIGRGSPLGNMYTHLKLSKTKAKYHCKTLEESIEKFEKELKKNIEQKDVSVCRALNDIVLMARKGDVNLVCYCKPKSCHGDIIKRIIEEKLKNTNHGNDARI